RRRHAGHGPGTDPHRRLALADGNVREARQEPARGLPALRKGGQRQGWLLGRKVQFVVYDDQSMPATAVRLYEKLITEDMVDAIMGPYSSPVTEASVNVTEKYKKVMVAPLAATSSIFKRPPGQKRNYVFMVI